MSFASERFTRRGLLVAGGTALLAGLAGCRTESNDSTPTDSGGSQSPSDSTDVADGSSSGDDSDGEDGATGGDNGGSEDGTSGGEPDDLETDAETVDTAVGTATPELDLREANVTAVEFEGSDGSYDFQVTLYHDDDGEDGYADWWQVESLAGEQLGRRELLHAHSTAPFTRSETIDVPAGTACVVVRGHDQTHGYGGQAMLVNLDTGGTRAVDQGTEREGFGESDCP